MKERIFRCLARQANRLAQMAVAALLLGAATTPAVAAGTPHDLSAFPQCGGQPCIAVATPETLHAPAKPAGQAISAGPDITLHVPSGYIARTHNGTVDAFKYANGKALLLHTTSIQEFSDLGNKQGWRVIRKNDLAIFVHRGDTPGKWRAFVVRTGTKRYGGAMLELYSVGLSQREFDAVLGSIKAEK